MYHGINASGHRVSQNRLPVTEVNAASRRVDGLIFDRAGNLRLSDGEPGFVVLLHLPLLLQMLIPGHGGQSTRFLRRNPILLGEPFDRLVLLSCSGNQNLAPLIRGQEIRGWRSPRKLLL